MKILHIKPERYFLVETQRDVENIALKVLNERRSLCLDDDNPKQREFIEKVTEAMDGDIASVMLGKLYDVDIIAPEVL